MARRNTKRRARITHRCKTHHKRHALKRKQRGGGSLDRLPLAVNPEIDAALQSVPPGLKKEEFRRAALAANPSVVLKTLDEFDKGWDFKLVMGHGVLIPADPVSVPENTYVVFNSPAGCIALAMEGLPLPDIIVGTRDEFLMKLAGSHIFLEGMFESPHSGQRAKIEAEGCYPDAFFTEDQENRLARSTIKLKGKTKLRTIYAPGDLIPEMNIRFANNLYQQLILGVYDLPLNPALEKRIHDSYAFLLDDAYRTAIAARGQLAATQQKLIESGLELTYKADQALFGKPDRENYHPEYVSAAKTWQDAQAKESPADIKLSRILAEMPPLAEGKKRLIFIGSCRGITCKLPESNVVLLTRAARRASLDPTQMAQFITNFKAAEAARVAKEVATAAKYTLGSAAPAAAIDPKQRMRDIVKGMLGKAPLPKPPASPQERKNAQAEITRQKAAESAGSAAPGTNGAFAGGPYA